MPTTELNFKSTNQTWTLKAEDAGYTGYPNSGQFSIYNGANKLWGLNESGWIQNPTVILFSSYGNSGGTSFNSVTVVPYNQIVDNVGGHYDPTTYTFTAPIDGKYFFSASFLEYPSASTGSITFWCSKNGAGYNSSYPMSRGPLTSQQTLGWHGHVSLSAGDYIQAKIEGTGTYYTSGGHAHFSGHLIG